jgi:ATP-binding cassette subfamily F protein uup
MLSEPQNLLILDEPTNDLDTATLGALEAMLVELGGSALVVTHDRWFLDRVATAILAFEGDGKVVRYAGNYASYLLQKEAAEAAPPKPAGATRAAPSPPSPRAAPVASTAKPLTYAERLELDGILDRIDAADSAAQALEATLADPTIYASRSAEVPALVGELEKARAEAATLTARWEALELRRAAS